MAVLRAIALAIVFGVAAVPSLAASPPTPVFAGDGNTECRQTWEHLAECRDKRTGRIVARCRLDNMTGRWNCERV
jgi:hypothetical protein